MDRELVANGGIILKVKPLGTYTIEAQSSSCEAVDKVNFKNGFLPARYWLKRSWPREKIVHFANSSYNNREKNLKRILICVHGP